MRNIWDEIVEERKDEWLNEGRTEDLEQTAMTHFDMGMAVDKIAQAVHTSVNIVEEWLSAKRCETAAK